MNNVLNLEKLKELEEQIKSGSITYETFERVIEEYKKIGFYLEKLLEYAIKNTSKDNTKLQRLYEEIKLKNIRNLCDELRNYGESLQETELRKRFYDEDKEKPSGMTFRILELSRLGKRDEVFYILLREFVTAGEEFNEKLLKIFNPQYSIESFRVLLYSFFSGLFGNL